jgi:outer membrane scaffolding protein for murein synthesis (MipA/OmpV family)
MRENITEADNSSSNNHFQKDNKRNCYDYRIINYNIQNIHSSFFGIITYFGLQQRFGGSIRNTARPLPLRTTKEITDEHTCLMQVLNPPMF